MGFRAGFRCAAQRAAGTTSLFYSSSGGGTPRTPRGCRGGLAPRGPVKQHALEVVGPGLQLVSGEIVRNVGALIVQTATFQPSSSCFASMASRDPGDGLSHRAPGPDPPPSSAAPGERALPAWLHPGMPADLIPLNLTCCCPASRFLLLSIAFRRVSRLLGLPCWALHDLFPTHLFSLLLLPPPRPSTACIRHTKPSHGPRLGFFLLQYGFDCISL